MIKYGVAGAAAMLMAGCATPMSGGGDAMSKSARGAPSENSLHASILTMDAHLDTPAYFHRPAYNFSQRGSYEEDRTQVDLPRLEEGQLDGGFWVIYTPQGVLHEAAYAAARTDAVLRQMAIREMAAKYSDSVELAFNADDAERIHSEGKIVVYQSMENAYPLGLDVSLLRTFYVAGLRMMGPVHFRNNQFADSATDEPIYGGLSPLGEELIREANRLGMLIDASHASDDALRDMMALSTTPVILSHSGPDGVYEHPRNVPDDLLVELAEMGGVVHVNAYGSYLEELNPTPERQAALDALNAEYGGDIGSLSDAQMQAYRADRMALDAEFPPPRSTLDKYLEHLFHTLDLVGPDHVGIGADWDGGGGVDGMVDIVDVPKITDALIEAGYSDQDIANIWGGNLLRVMRQVEAARTSTLSSPDVLK